MPQSLLLTVKEKTSISKTNSFPRRLLIFAETRNQLKMKKIKLIALFTLCVGLFACGGDAGKTEGSTTDSTEVAKKDYKGMEKVDLSDYGMNADIYIPSSDNGKQEFRATERESLEIEVGQNYGIEIIPFGLSINEQKEELAGDLVYHVEYVEETPNKIIYKKTIKDNDIEEIHFIINVEINGEPYTLKSLNKSYKEKAIQKMVLSAESITAKNPA